MQNNFPLGQIVQSIGGRDKGQYYIVVGHSANRVLVVDGKYKLLIKPKQKNIVHLKRINVNDNEIATKLAQGKKINDSMVYHTLYEYQKKSPKEGE